MFWLAGLCLLLGSCLYTLTLTMEEPHFSLHGVAFTVTVVLPSWQRVAGEHMGDCRELRGNQDGERGAVSSTDP